MEGGHEGPTRGIIPRAIEDVFQYIESDRQAAQSKFLVRASYLQIYNEVRLILYWWTGTCRRYQDCLQHAGGTAWGVGLSQDAESRGC